MTLTELLLVLRQNGVEEFKNSDISVRFGSRASLVDPLVNNAADGIKFEPNKDLPSADLPIDDDVMFYSGQ